MTEYEERHGVSAWAALQAWNEASDSDTALRIRERAAEIAAARGRWVACVLCLQTYEQGHAGTCPLAEED